MTMLSLKARICCPRCSYQTAGWVVSEFGFTYCVMCGHVIADSGHHGISFKETFQQFANVRPNACAKEEVHDCHRKEPMDNDLALQRISHALEQCCRGHNGGAGTLPLCEQCKQKYDALAEKSVDFRVKSVDIYEAIKFKMEAEKV